MKNEIVPRRNIQDQVDKGYYNAFLDDIDADVIFRAIHKYIFNKKERIFFTEFLLKLPEKKQKEMIKFIKDTYEPYVLLLSINTLKLINKKIHQIFGV